VRHTDSRTWVGGVEHRGNGAGIQQGEAYRWNRPYVSQVLILLNYRYHIYLCAGHIVPSCSLPNWLTEIFFLNILTLVISTLTLSTHIPFLRSIISVLRIFSSLVESVFKLLSVIDIGIYNLKDHKKHTVESL
jgi:hypothetical protein